MHIAALLTTFFFLYSQSPEKQNILSDGKTVGFFTVRRAVGQSWPLLSLVLQLLARRTRAACGGWSRAVWQQAHDRQSSIGAGGFKLQVEGVTRANPNLTLGHEGEADPASGAAR